MPDGQSPQRLLLGSSALTLVNRAPGSRMWGSVRTWWLTCPRRSSPLEAGVSQTLVFPQTLLEPGDGTYAPRAARRVIRSACALPGGED